MKKGLLSILALAVTIVGCQNYDDQFDALNTQITALKSQVEGLSTIQSQVTSLAGTIASLQTTVSSLPSSSDVSSAISSGLTDIIADVEAIEAALADVATAADLESVSASVTDAQAALDNLLESSNVYSEDLVVNSQGTLDFAVALGEKLAIVNGSVYVNVTPQMNTTDVQTVMDNIGTVVEDFSYVAAATVSPVTFSKITGVAGNLEVSQAGPYAFEGLISAGNIHLATGSKMTAVHFDALTTVSSINVSTLTDHGAGHGNGTVAARVQASIVTANAISGTKLAAVKLGSLPYYTPGSLSITTKDEESTVNISMLASVDADGDEAALNLTIDGATAVDFSKITKGNIVASNVTDLTGGTDHDGNVTVTKVTNVVLPNLTGTFSATEKATLATFHAIGGGKGTTTLTYTDLSLEGFTKLTSAIVEGTFGDVTLKDNSRLTDVTYKAAADNLMFDGNDDIEALTLEGTATNITVQNNTNMVTLDIDTELFAGTGATAVTAGTLKVHANADLEELHSAFDPVDNIGVHHNGSLAKVDFTGTSSGGAATDAVAVEIGGNGKENALSASSVVDSYDATAAADTGVMSDESGLSTLSTYVSNVASTTTSFDIKIYLDEIEEYTPAGATATSTVETIDNITWADTTNNGQLAVVNLTNSTAASTTGAKAAVAGKAAWEYTPGPGNALNLDHTFNGITTAIVDLTGTSQNPLLAIDEILSTEATAAADAVGVTLGAVRGGKASLSIAIQTIVNSTTSEGVTGATNSTTAVAATDILTFTVNGKTSTGTGGSALSTGAAIAARIKANWDVDAAATISNTMFDVTVGSGASSNVITITGKEKFGSLTNGKGFALSVAEAATATGTLPIIGYKAGNFLATTDNTTVSNNIIVSVLSDDSGVDANTAQAGAIATASGDAVTSSLTASATADVATAANAVAGTTTPAQTGNTTNRLTWISGS